MKKIYTRIWVLLFFSLFNGLSLPAQNPSIAIGQWRGHIPFNKVIGVAEVGGTVYSASQYGVFSYSKSDGEINLYTQLNGLSDYEISGICADKQSGIVLIAYQTSNIDLLFPDHSIVNLSDIKRKNIIGGKRINHILFAEGNAYLSCEFGIVVINLSRREISDTYYIGQNGRNANVNGLAYNGTQFLAATDSGMFMANSNDPNIFNYTAWFRENNLFSPTANYTSVTAFNGKFYAVKTNPAFAMDTVLENNGGTWIPYLNDAYEGGRIDSYNNLFLYRNDFKVSAWDANGALVNQLNVVMYDNGSIVSGFQDDAGIFWVADKYNGLVRYSYSPFSIDAITPNGPRSAAVWAMDSQNGNTWVASGSLKGDAVNPQERNGFYLFSDNTWSTYDETNDSIYTALALGSPALLAVAIDPSDAEHAFFASWGVGVMEARKSGGVKIYNGTNSTLNVNNGIPNYIITGGLTFDEENNLWVGAGGNTSPISVRRPDGSWQAFVIPDADVARFALYQMLVDDYNQKWFILREGANAGQGIGVFNENDPANSNDDNFRRITGDPGKGALPDMFVRSLAKDKDGAIWIGTDKGVSVIYNPGNVFSGDPFDSQRIIIEQDGNAQYLLETEAVTAITIDGANRKWFGTTSGGVFLMSADGTKQLLNFNIDNSPLPSNTIMSITIDEKSGEVFFGTDKGIVSYRSTATEGGEVCDNYFVFPNPIRHDYSGPIAIRGLIENADVKITDVAGNLVFHTVANGGQAIWNGTNFEGVRVQTGIYTVFISNGDGTETCTTKLLFAN